MGLEPFHTSVTGVRITRICVSLLLAVIITVLNTGCASMNQQVTSPVQPTYLSVRRPVLTPLAETNATQEKGGLTVVVEPILYTTRLDSIIRDETRKPALLEPLAWGDNATFFTRHVSPTATYEPSRLGFNVRMVNGINHVVRGAGTVVSAVIDGRQVAMSQEGYVDLVNAVIIPRGEVSLQITGPEIATLPDSCTFGLFFYDFVTATDAAGNPIERQNFEWYYSITRVLDRVEGQSYSVKMVRDAAGVHTAKR